METDVDDLDALVLESLQDPSEHLHASDRGTEVEVVVVEPTGAEVQVFARIDGHDITAVLRERLMLKPGEMVRFAPDTELVHVFDAASGERV